jgi:hypothetical protein
MNLEIKGKNKRIVLKIHWALYVMAFILIIFFTLLAHVDTLVQPDVTNVVVEETKVIEPVYEVTTTPGKGVCITDVHGVMECYE